MRNGAELAQQALAALGTDAVLRSMWQHTASVIPAPEDLTPSSGLGGHYMHMEHRYTHGQNTHTCQINKSKHF